MTDTTAQPVPLSLIIALYEFALARGAGAADDRIFRNRRGQAVSKQVHETIWRHVRDQLAFAAAMDAATHCLRKTAGTAVERHTGVAVSDAFLRHTAPTLNGVYTGAALEEVATTVSDLTGETHPLAYATPSPPWRRCCCRRDAVPARAPSARGRSRSSS